MKLSILLPTKNGGDYLAGCIGSILNQTPSALEIELVISDNASTDKTPEIIGQFAGDKRIKHHRLSQPVPVTDNWRNALNNSSGDYVLVVGDDDALMPDCTNKLEAALKRFEYPACLAFNGYLYVAPGAIYGNKHSYFKNPYHNFFDHHPNGGILTMEERELMVRKAFDFNPAFPLNMQLTLFSRSQGMNIRGGIFRPPFPDHYGLNALLLESRNFAVIPGRLVVIGVSAKSFGHYYFSNEHQEGMEFLDSNSNFPGRVPGNEIHNSMYKWLLMLKENYPDRLENIAVNHSKYLELQAQYWLSLGAIRQIPLHQSLKNALRGCRNLSYAAWRRLAVGFGKAWLKHLKRKIRSFGRPAAAIEDVLPIKPLANVNTITEFIEHISAEESR